MDIGRWITTSYAFDRFNDVPTQYKSHSVEDTFVGENYTVWKKRKIQFETSAMHMSYGNVNGWSLLVAIF